MYICPICKKALELNERTLKCAGGHSFDLHRKGYVNLLTTKKHNPKKSGDNGDMVRARTEFLDFGHYERLAQRAAQIMGELTADCDEPVIIDSGCGEGYYTVQYAKALEKARIYGVDISKGACSHAMSRVNEKGLTNVQIAVASAFELPFEDKSADLIVCTFAPVSDREYARVLKDGGGLLVISPSPEHLYELKALIYDEPYKNKPNEYGLESFIEGPEEILEYKAQLASREEILSLYRMTPYSFKTSKPDSAKLIETESLEVTCGFSIRRFTKE